MAKDNKINMPSGMGGITRYFDEYKSKFEMAPGYVLVLIVLIIIIILVLHWQGGSLAGLA
jgi:preprotein translocase subunit Sec61beta